MILNKSSVERGFAHASVYKTEVGLQWAVHVHIQGVVCLFVLLLVCGPVQDQC